MPVLPLSLYLVVLGELLVSYGQIIARLLHQRPREWFVGAYENMPVTTPVTMNSIHRQPVLKQVVNEIGKATQVLLPRITES